VITLCPWVVGDPKERRQCNAPLKYTMVYDGGEVGAAKVRKYQTFCDAHTEAASYDEE
jgi:hypothetical protein